MSLDSSLVSFVVRRPHALVQLQQAGVTEDDFTDEFRNVWRYVVRMKRNTGNVPSRAVVEHRFPEVELVKTREGDLPILVSDLRKRRKWREFLDIIDEAAVNATDPDEIDDVIQVMQGQVNALAYQNGEMSHIVDLFSNATKKRMFQEIKNRRLGKELGLRTGLNRIDTMTGGLMRRRMIVVMGRPGLGKSWLDLLFVAQAVIDGYKIGLYPLEMTLQETAFRLYTIFSQKMFGANKVIKNTDLSMGFVSKRKIIRFLNALEDQFAGQLFVADVGSLSDPYTTERIEADQEIYHFDMFWVDYLTLLKAPGGWEAEDYNSVKTLSNGIKGIAQRQNCVGGCSAQVNREAMKVRAFLPRVEHIAYGDSIGQDADQVISINRRGDHLYYAMVKNRHGPEIGKTRVKFFVNEGIIEEDPEQGEDDDDE